MRNKTILTIALSFFCSYQFAQTPPKLPLRPSDVYWQKRITDARCSPDGKWVSYVLSTVDTSKDKQNADVWMVSWDGKENIQLTNSADNETNPKWSPDEKWISFLSARQDAKDKQVWLMDRRGGEGKKITSIKGGINDYEWSPDAKRLLLTITDNDEDDTAKSKTTKPYVIDRYQYKQDVEGYRYKKIYTHLYLFTLATKKLDTLTSGSHNEGSATWSPDGSSIAFVSNRTKDPDRNENTDLFIIESRPGAQAKQLTYWTGSDDHPKWSPDGKWIAYTRSTDSSDYLMYDQPVLAVISKDGGEPKLVSKTLDRPAMEPRWSSDGKSLFALVEDDQQQYVAKFSVSNGQMTKVAFGEKVYESLETGPANNWLVMMTNPQLPTEIYALENGNARRLTYQQDEFVDRLELASVQGFKSTSSDGTIVSGMLFLPPHSTPKPSLPMILFIHGGPVGQDAFRFDINRQMLACAGFAVISVNYRGSSGRGLDYCKVISADWGNKEVIDLHGAVDYMVKQGVANPDKLGVGGWSYGGILTDYLIASDDRFKAACSGAGTGFTLSLYGVDQYISQYNNEIGYPWKSIDKYLKISYPFLKADQIKTPTLFLSGEKDFNVPTAGSEQMYQALRSVGTPTELIIYPNQFHGITVPSYQKDRLERYLAWYSKYLK